MIYRPKHFREWALLFAIYAAVTLAVVLAGGIR